MMRCTTPTRTISKAREAHTHPDYREVTVLSGTWRTGYGEKFDAAALKALPAGSC